MKQITFTVLGVLLVLWGLGCEQDMQNGDMSSPEAEYTLSADQTHSSWSNTHEPLINVESGAVIEVEYRGGFRSAAYARIHGGRSGRSQL